MGHRQPSSFLPLKPRTFLLLAILSEGPRHGFALIQEMEVRSAGALRIDPGLLYRTIARLRDDGLIRRTSQRPADGGDDPRRKYYRLTALGETVLRAEAERQTALLETMTGGITAGVRGRS